MNTIKIYLKDSGSIAELYKDFRLYAGSYQDKSIKVYVPKSMVYQSTDLNTMLATVKVGAILTNEKGQKITTKSYAVVYIAEEVVNGIDYLVYERQLPKEFCAIAGSQTVVVNVENMLNESEQKTVLSIITSQTAILEVLDSASLNENEVVDPTELDLINGQINDIYQAIGLGEIDYDDVINRVETLENNSVTLDTEQTITATKTFEIPMGTTSANKGIVFKRGSGGGALPDAIVFKDEDNVEIGSIGFGIDDRINLKGNIVFLYNANRLSVEEIPTKIELSINPSNYILSATLRNLDNSIVSTSTVDLPLESMVVNGTYDNETKEVVLTLQNGNEVKFSVADLVSGLVSQTDFDSFVANTPQLNKENTFTQTQTFTAKIGSTPQNGIVINTEGTNGGFPDLITFKDSDGTLGRFICSNNSVNYLGNIIFGSKGNADLLRLEYPYVNPGNDGGISLGSSSRRWKELYLSGNLSDGTNSITIAEIVNKGSGVGQTYPNSTNGEIFNEYANNAASGDYSHAQGYYTRASGRYTFTGGEGTYANHDHQTALGKYNLNKYENLFEIGNGLGISNNSNAFEVSRDGRAFVNNGKELATQEYVNNLIGGVSAVLGNTEDLGV